MTQMKNVCGALLLWALCSLPAQAVCHWPEWDHFRQHYISEEGRVIDPADGRRITTSEGQSYALFFALVNDDRGDLCPPARLDGAAARPRGSDRLPPSLALGQAAGRQLGRAGCEQRVRFGSLDSLQPAGGGSPVGQPQLLCPRHPVAAPHRWGKRSPRCRVSAPCCCPGRKAMRGGTLDPQPQLSAPQLLARFASFKGPWGEMRALLPKLLQESAPVALPRTGWTGRPTRDGR